MDHRHLLCKVCLSLGQCRNKLLDAKGGIAWISKAAIAADPNYSNGYSQLSIGLQHTEKFEEAIENCKKALKVLKGLLMQSPTQGSGRPHCMKF